MKFLKLIFPLFLLIISCENEEQPVQGKPYLSADEMTVYVSFVNDGDTFTFYYEEYSYLVRVLGIDAFETSKGERLQNQADKFNISLDSALTLGLLAKEFAIETLLNKNVVIKREEGERNTDVYDRLLRHVFVDGISFDSLMLTKNFAFPYE